MKKETRGQFFQSSADRGFGIALKDEFDRLTREGKLPPAMLDKSDLDKILRSGGKVLEIVVDPETKVGHSVKIERSI